MRDDKSKFYLNKINNIIVDALIVLFFPVDLRKDNTSLEPRTTIGCGDIGPSMLK